MMKDIDQLIKEQKAKIEEELKELYIDFYKIMV